MTWSYSRLHSFEQCRYGWFLKYIHGSKGEDKFYSSYGSFIHRLLELYYRGFYEASELKDAFVSGFSGNVKGERPDENIVRKYIQSGIEYFESFERVPFPVIAVERKLDFTLDGVRLTGILDLLGEENGEYIIVDNKSRDLKPRSKRKSPTEGDKLLDSMLRQLYLYAYGVKQVYGKFPKELCFNCFKSGTFIREPFVSERCEEALSWVKERVTEIKNEEDFRPTIEYFFCRYLCDVSHDCVYCT